jgi:predicted nucleotidyltransferase
MADATLPPARVTVPDVRTQIALDDAALSAFCDRWRVRRLELFGSVIRDDFRPDSDIDVLVTFKPDADWGLLDHAVMEEELSALFGRPVDPISRRAIKRSANAIRRASILESAVPLFTAHPPADAMLSRAAMSPQEFYAEVTRRPDASELLRRLAR